MARRCRPCALLCSAWLIACAGTEEPLITTTAATTSDSGAGGTVGTGGAASTGGAAGTGGAASTGGISSTGLPPDATFQIQLSGGLDQSVEADVYDVDLNGTTTAQFTSLHTAGRIVGCYFSAGTLETFRDDAGDFPAPSVGNPHPEYPSERWLDVRSSAVRTLMVARIELARIKGCDAVHPANVKVFSRDSGFTISAAENASFALALAAAAHERGLTVAWSDEPDAFPELEKTFDWGIAIECLEPGRCSRWFPFRDAGKKVFVVEVGTAADASRICPAAAALGFDAIIKDRNYTAFRVGCP